MNQQRVLVETKPHNQQNQQNQLNQHIQNKEYEIPLQHYNISQTPLPSFELPLRNYNDVLELGKLENEANKIIQKENETKSEKGIKI